MLGELVRIWFSPLSSQVWTPPQKKWLERIGEQLKVETIADREALDRGEFRAQGGFRRMNKGV